jgi:hypothetical protein
VTNLAYLVIFIADFMAKVKSDCQGESHRVAILAHGKGG